MGFVGLQRFIHYRQREEIRDALLNEHGISLSSGQVSNLTRRFLKYLEALHQARSEQIREALANDGGWPMPLFLTCVGCFRPSAPPVP